MLLHAARAHLKDKWQNCAGLVEGHRQRVCGRTARQPLGKEGEQKLLEDLNRAQREPET